MHVSEFTFLKSKIQIGLYIESKTSDGNVLNTTQSQIFSHWENVDYYSFKLVLLLYYESITDIRGPACLTSPTNLQALFICGAQ